MKIALVSPYDYAYPGGVNDHIAHLKNQFTSRGNSVKIVAPSSSPKSHQDSDIIVVGKPWPIPASGSVARITITPWLSVQVKAVLSQESFDIVHVHEPLCPALPIEFLRFSEAVNVGTFHAYHGKNRGYRYANRILRRYSSKLHGRIAVSPPALEFINRYFPGQYIVIPNGIDTARFSPEGPVLEEYRDDKLNILFLGRLEKRKGLPYLLRAYQRVKRGFRNVRLIVAGDGALSEGCQRFVEDNGLEDVVFRGYVSEDEKPAYYRTADIFCAPATGRESFGIVLLEAMATGKPIVASRIEGFTSLMEDGAEGILVEPKDERDLASALICLLGDEALRSKMGTKGRITARSYSWQQISQRIMDYYATLLDGPSQSNHQEIRWPN
ncbi:MAG: glycosyltransferase family 4 protein [Chloroflexi bacterium]|nr:glycosyltransferase family 4 protein [Chloroflexota bacterium]